MKKIETPEEFAQKIKDYCFDAWTMNYEQKQYMGEFDLDEATRLITDFTALARADERQRAAGWISVKEQLPENDDPTVVTNNINSWKDHTWLVRGIKLDPKKPDIKDGEYCAWDGFNKIWGVTHWMPLPDPPAIMADPQMVDNDWTEMAEPEEGNHDKIRM